MTAQSFKKLKDVQQGFTLIELLIVIVIITALAVTVFVALNPAQRIKQANDARRTADVETILTAIHEATVDGSGALPAGLTANGSDYQIGSAVAGCTYTAAQSPNCSALQAACANVSVALANYLKSLPTDPNPPAGITVDQTKTGYAVNVSATGLITVKACFPAIAASIQQSR